MAQRRNNKVLQEIKHSQMYRFLLLRKITQKRFKEPLDRVQVEREIRLAKRRGELSKIYELALTHPLRPLSVFSQDLQGKLKKEGFLLIPGSNCLMLPPDGVSRREAKARRDTLLTGGDIESNRELPQENQPLSSKVEPEPPRQYREKTSFTFQDLLKG